MVSLTRRISLLAVTLFICSAAPARSSGQETAEVDKTYTLYGSGDSMLARWVHQGIYRRGAASAFAQVKEDIDGADIAMTNLECVVSTIGEFFHKGEGRPYLYRARPEMLDVLTEAGFDLVTTGNNHALDYGPEALMEQLEILESIGIASAGSGKNLKESRATTFVKVDDLVVGFINPTDFPSRFEASDDRPGVFFSKRSDMIDTLEEIVPEARKTADLLVFSPHWGKNWTDGPTEEMIEIAHAFIDMGGDAIMGHSSHHVHGVEIYKGKPIIYDMGSVFFDTVRQNRLGLSAGWTLEFDRGGFKKLTVRPYRLLSCVTTPAKGAVLDRIKGIIVKETKKLDPDLQLVDEGDRLSVSFAAEDPAPPRAAEPARVHTSGSTRPLPDKYRNKKSNVVFSRAPEWTKGFRPIELDNGVVVLGYRNVEAVRRGKAFKSEVALEAPGKLRRRWETQVVGVQRNGDAGFTWRHPIADGAAIPEIWEKGDIVVDKTLARPQKKPAGVYDLYWVMENLANKKRAKPVKPIPGVPDRKLLEGAIPMGEIHILNKGIPKTPAGVAWDGKLPSKAVKNPDGTVEVADDTWIYIVVGAAGLLLIIAIVVVVVVKRRKGNRPAVQNDDKETSE